MIDLIWDIENYDVLEIVFEKTSTVKCLKNIHKELLNIALSNNNKRFIKYYFDKYKEKKIMIKISLIYVFYITLKKWLLYFKSI